MARAPSSGGKTRLWVDLSPSRLAALRAALVADTLDLTGRAGDTLGLDVVVFCTPAEGAAEISALSGRALDIVPQADGDLGLRMRSALTYLLDGRGRRGAQNPPSPPSDPTEIESSVRRCESAILVGTDIPFLSAAHLADARDLLQSSGGVVLGPADDGGYFLIGMTEVQAPLFEDVAWGTSSVLTDTLRAAERSGVEARLIGSAYDIDTADDLLRLERDLASAAADVAPHMRAWFAAR
jgi:glycosyltransferase A (GT-A) superfamily protein (DUF2064 family)